MLIEKDKKIFKDLFKTYEKNPQVICLNKTIGFKQDNLIDIILSKISIPFNFDLLSIDVDGLDYHIWASMKIFKPKVVVIEFNPTIPNDVRFIQKKDMKINQGSSLLSIILLAKKKGYELVTTTLTNAIFVKKKFFDLFDLKNNSIDVMNDSKFLQTRIFQLYDGTLVVVGRNRLNWHRIINLQNKIQVLPKFLRKYPQNYNIFQKIIFNAYMIIYRVFF